MESRRPLGKDIPEAPRNMPHTRSDIFFTLSGIGGCSPRSRCTKATKSLSDTGFSMNSWAPKTNALVGQRCIKGIRADGKRVLGLHTARHWIINSAPVGGPGVSQRMIAASKEMLGIGKRPRRCHHARRTRQPRLRRGLGQEPRSAARLLPSFLQANFWPCCRRNPVANNCLLGGRLFDNDSAATTARYVLGDRKPPRPPQFAFDQSPLIDCSRLVNQEWSHCVCETKKDTAFGFSSMDANHRTLYDAGVRTLYYSPHEYLLNDDFQVLAK